MKKYLILFILFPLLTNNAQLFPTLGGQRAGISTAQFLKIGVGGRATGMADAFVALADDASALYWNPAGLAYSKQNEIIFSHNEWVVDIKHEFIGATYKLSSNDVIGVSFTSLHMDDMPVTTEVLPFGTGEYFSFGDIAIGVTYSRKMTEQFSFGGTVRYIEETLDKLKMRGFMIDLGTMYWTGLGTTRFAVAITNFGNELAPDGKVVLFGKREKSDWQSFSPPTMFRIGFALEPYQTDMHRITSSIQLNHPNDNSENVSIGAEYAWKEIFFARGGYKLNVDEQDFTFGAGLKVPLGIANVTVDYAYSKFSRLGAAHRFSILLGMY
jgi:long-subunit fatty acid transport protein